MDMSIVSIVYNVHIVQVAHLGIMTPLSKCEGSSIFKITFLENFLRHIWTPANIPPVAAGVHQVEVRRKHWRTKGCLRQTSVEFATQCPTRTILCPPVSANSPPGRIESGRLRRCPPWTTVCPPVSAVDFDLADTG